MTARHHVVVVGMVGAIALCLLVGLLPVVAGTGFSWDEPVFGTVAAAGLLAGLLLAAVLARAAVAIARRREYPWADVASDVPLIAASLGLVAGAYTWGKLLIPVINPRQWDAALWKADQALCFGLDPNRVLLSIVHDNPRWLGWALDAHYGLFLLLFLAGAIWLLTDADRAVRLHAAAAMGLLWLTGVTLYFALPSLGPALVDLELWRGVLAVCPNAAGMERELLRKGGAVREVLAGGTAAVNPGFGIAAFPSLHVAAHVQLALLFWGRARRQRAMAREALRTAWEQLHRGPGAQRVLDVSDQPWQVQMSSALAAGAEAGKRLCASIELWADLVAARRPRPTFSVGTWVWTLIACLTFVGSIVTGWHYLVDSLAGVVIAVIATPAMGKPR